MQLRYCFWLFFHIDDIKNNTAKNAWRVLNTLYTDVDSIFWDLVWYDNKHNYIDGSGKSYINKYTDEKGVMHKITTNDLDYEKAKLEI